MKGGFQSSGSFHILLLWLQALLLSITSKFRNLWRSSSSCCSIASVPLHPRCKNHNAFTLKQDKNVTKKLGEVSKWPQNQENGKGQREKGKLWQITEDNLTNERKKNKKKTMTNTFLFSLCYFEPFMCKLFPFCFVIFF